MPPVTPTYPGVYIEEIPSGTRTIVGVQTSITAFIGRTPTGPIDEPMTCFNFADFERFFGGRSYKYPLSYSVEDFFNNGGSQAIVVRTFRRDANNTPEQCTAKFTLAGGLPISAIGPGTWGNQLQLSFDYIGLRTAGATSAKARVRIALSDFAPDGENVSIAIAPAAATPPPAPAPPAPGPPAPPAPAPPPAAGAITAQYTTKPGDTALAVAQGLAADFNTKAGTTYRAATASGGIDDLHATLTFSTAQQGAAANGATVKATGSATVSLDADASFTGGGDAKPTAATATITVGGTATASATPPAADSGIGTSGTLTFQVQAPGAPATLVPVQVNTGDTAPTVAKNLASALSRALAGTNALLKPATVDKAGTKVTLTAAATGTDGNGITVKPVGSPPPGITIDTPAAGVPLAGGADTGYDTSLADAAAASLAHYGVTGDDLFNVTITYSPKGKLPVTERYTAVSVVGEQSPKRIDRVINAQSLIVKVNPDNLSWTFATPGSSDATVIQLPGKNGKSFTASGGKDSDPLEPSDFLGDELERTAMYALEEVSLFNLLCIPPDQRADDASAPDGSDGSAQSASVYAEAAEFCAKRRAMLICDPPRTWSEHAGAGLYNLITPTDVGVTTEDGGRNAAVYFPYIEKADLELNGKTELFAPSGTIAGQFAQTDTTRGVWKAPAGMETGLEGVTGLDVNMSDDQNGLLNPLGINALRDFPIIGPVIWGARTLRGADVFSDDYKYVPVRRLTLYIEESLYQGTKWAVFEPNDDTLWSQLRLSVGSFMAGLARLGAFYSYSVTCDKTTTLDTDIAQGIVNVVVAFNPVKPAEFIVLKIAQLAGQNPG